MPKCKSYAEIKILQGRPILHDVSTNSTDRKPYKSGTKDLYTKEGKGLKALHSKLLNKPPTNINTEKRKLNRKTSCKLAQLRGGYPLVLNSYGNRLDPGEEPVEGTRPTDSPPVNDDLTVVVETTATHSFCGIEINNKVLFLKLPE